MRWKEIFSTCCPPRHLKHAKWCLPIDFFFVKSKKNVTFQHLCRFFFKLSTYTKINPGYMEPWSDLNLQYPPYTILDRIILFIVYLLQVVLLIPSSPEINTMQRLHNEWKEVSARMSSLGSHENTSPVIKIKLPSGLGVFRQDFQIFLRSQHRDWIIPAKSSIFSYLCTNWGEGPLIELSPLGSGRPFAPNRIICEC